MVLVKLLRVDQWSKNLIIFLVLIGRGSTETSDWITLFYVFFGLSLLASAGYLVNDIKDRDSDIRHPYKKNRPIASGVVKVKDAITVSIFLISVGLFILLKINYISLWLGAAYLLGSLSYTFKIKQVPIIESLMIPLLFILRLLVGSVATGISASLYLLLSTFFITTVITISKRYSILVNEEIELGSPTKKLVATYYSKTILIRLYKLFSFLLMSIFVTWIVNNLNEQTNSLQLVQYSISFLCLAEFLRSLFSGTIGGLTEDFAYYFIKERKTIILFIIGLLFCVSAIY